MNLQQIVGLDWAAEELEKLSDKELIEKLSPCFNTTRPKLAKREGGVRKFETPVMDFKMKERIGQLAKLGIDISNIAKFKGVKKK